MKFNMMSLTLIFHPQTNRDFQLIRNSTVQKKMLKSTTLPLVERFINTFAMGYHSEWNEESSQIEVDSSFRYASFRMTGIFLIVNLIMKRSTSA